MPRARRNGPLRPRASLIRLRASAHPEGATRGHPAPGSGVCVGRAPLRDCPLGAAWGRRVGVAPLPSGERLGEGPAALDAPHGSYRPGPHPNPLPEGEGARARRPRRLNLPQTCFRYAFRGTAAVASGSRLRREAQPYTSTASIAGARSARAAGGCPRKGGGERESNPPSDAWRHPPGLKPGRPTRDVSPPDGRPLRGAHGMLFCAILPWLWCLRGRPGNRCRRSRRLCNRQRLTPHAPRPPNIAVSGRSRCVSLTRRV